MVTYMATNTQQESIARNNKTVLPAPTRIPGSAATALLNFLWGSTRLWSSSAGAL